MTDDSPVVLVISSGQRRYREYLLSAAADNGNLWLLDESVPDWQLKYIVGGSQTDLRDPGAMIATVRGIASQRPIEGLICYDELVIEPTAYVVEALGLRGMTVEAVRLCRDKNGTRTALSGAGIVQPRSQPVGSLVDAKRIATEIGYPVVLKPRNLGASWGVRMVSSPAELAGAYEIASTVRLPGVPALSDGVLVEEYVAGSEISIDGCVADGVYNPVYLARKQLGEPPYFEEVGHVVDANDPLLIDPELRALLSRAHEALGINDAITHTEVRFASRGPVIIEVNARLGGDLIPHIGELATGISPGRLAVDIAAGRKPDLTQRRRDVVGIRFLYPPHECQVRAVVLPEPDPSIGLIEAAPLVDEGSELRLQPHGYLQRYAFVICTADNPLNCLNYLAAAAARARLDWAIKPKEVAGYDS